MRPFCLANVTSQLGSMLKVTIIAFCLSGIGMAATPESLVGMDFTRAWCEALIAPIYEEVRRDLNLPMATDLRPRMTLHETQWAQLDADRAKRAKILEPLSPAQRIRLEEITLQWEGALCAFIRPSIADKLKLSTDQRRRVETILTLYREGLPNAGLYAERMGSSAGGHQLLLNKAADRLAESILTVEQRLRWNEMQGRRLEPEPTYWRRALQP